MSLLTPGTILQSKYRIDGPIAAGAQSQIYRATHLWLNRTVAIKLLDLGQFPPAEAHRKLERFRREAHILSVLQDPRTLTLLDFGQWSASSYFMVVEFIDGVDLKTLIETNGPQPAARVASIVYQILLSLQESHTLGFLHRDIKPANLMLYQHAGRKDWIKVLDFGVARGDQSLREGAALTGAGFVVGTPRYIAPELLKGGDYSTSSDLYALGLVARELLRGELGGQSTSFYAFYRDRMSRGDVTLEPALKVPQALAHFLERLMRFDPSQRHVSTDHALQDLHNAIRRMHSPQDSGQGLHEHAWLEHHMSTQEERVASARTELIDRELIESISSDTLKLQAIGPIDASRTGLPEELASGVTSSIDLDEIEKIRARTKADE